MCSAASAVAPELKAGPPFSPDLNLEFPSLIGTTPPTPEPKENNNTV